MKVTSSVVFSIIAAAMISSCTSKKEVVKQSKIENTAVESTVGIPYFKAIGTEPFWNVEIFEKEVIFKSLGNEKGIVFSNEKFEVFEEDKKYTFANKTHTLIIEAISGECSDGMSDLSYSHKVAVTIIDETTGKSSQNFGCGQFISESKLSNIWVLKTFRDQIVSANDFDDQAPYLELVSGSNVFSGFGGCNTINGQVIPNSKNRIKFSNIAATKMMCGKVNREQEFISALSKVGAYKFDGRTLILLDATYVPIATFQAK